MGGCYRSLHGSHRPGRDSSPPFLENDFQHPSRQVPRARKTTEVRPLTSVIGKRGIEDAAEMISKHPLFDDYWATKSIHVENIEVPLYLTASYSSGLHSRGSFQTFKKAKSLEKWLRVHPYQECMIITCSFSLSFLSYAPCNKQNHSLTFFSQGPTCTGPRSTMSFSHSLIDIAKA